MPKMINCGVIGLGVGMKHLEAYAKHPDAHTLYCADFDDEKLKAARQFYPEIKTTTDADEILESPDLDVISIASFDNFHCEQIIKAANAGKHLIVEKPVCLTREEKAKIDKVLAQNQVQLTSNMVLRTCPLFKEVKKKIHAGELGKIYNIKGDYLWGRVYKLTQGWRKDMPYYSLTLGALVHIVDLLVWLLESPVESVKASGNQLVTSHSDFKFDDFVSAQLKFQNGTLATIAAHGGCIHKHFHRLEVFGSKQTFLHNTSENCYITEQEEGFTKTPSTAAYPAKDERFRNIHSFLDSIHGETSPLVSYDDISNVMNICFAIEDSIKTDSTIYLK